MMSQLDPRRLEDFESAKEKIIGVNRLRPTIGTLSEKTVHAVLKYYLDPDEDHHEIPIGEFVADIYRENAKLETGAEILEIQTKQFYRMKRKLDAFLPQYLVTIAHPIPRRKNVIWVDEETGELTPPRKSPKKGSLYTAFAELCGIREYLTHPNLRIKLLLIDMEEFKLLDGYGPQRKKRATKFDRIPTLLAEEVDLVRPEDYMQFVPASLPERFTVSDFAKEAKIPKDLAGRVLPVLRSVGVVEKIGTAERRAYLYACRY